MTEGSTVNQNADQIDDGRRQAIVKLGRLVAYTAPAMMTLMVLRQGDGAVGQWPVAWRQGAGTAEKAGALGPSDLLRTELSTTVDLARPTVPAGAVCVKSESA
jgi:hypothetical protein